MVVVELEGVNAEVAIAHGTTKLAVSTSEWFLWDVLLGACHRMMIKLTLWMWSPIMRKNSLQTMPEMRLKWGLWMMDPMMERVKVMVVS